MKSNKMRADMCFPDGIRNSGLVIIALGIVLCLLFIFIKSNWAGLLGMLLIITGLSIIISWKNQTITIISDSEFFYRNATGKVKKYKFNDILAVKLESNSKIIFVGKDKIKIESFALISDRLDNMLNEHIEK